MPTKINQLTNPGRLQFVLFLETPGIELICYIRMPSVSPGAAKGSPMPGQEVYLRWDLYPDKGSCGNQHAVSPATEKFIKTIFMAFLHKF